MLDDERDAEISLLGFQRAEERMERMKNAIAARQKAEARANLTTLSFFPPDGELLPDGGECLSTAAFALKSLHYSLL